MKEQILHLIPNKFFILPLALVAILSLPSCNKISEWFFEAKSEEAIISKGMPAPDFSLKDLNGKTHKLSDYHGKYVVLEWADYECPYVEKHYNSGNMQTLQENYTQEGVVWLTIETKRRKFDKNKIQKQFGEWKANYNAYLLDAGGKVARSYGAQTTPHMYIINPNGEMIYQGAIDSVPSTDPKDIAGAVNYVSLALDEARSNKAITHSTTVPYGCAVKY